MGTIINNKKFNECDNINTDIDNTVKMAIDPSGILGLREAYDLIEKHKKEIAELKITTSTTSNTLNKYKTIIENNTENIVKNKEEITSLKLSNKTFRGDLLLLNNRIYDYMRSMNEYIDKVSKMKTIVIVSIMITIASVICSGVCIVKTVNTEKEIVQIENNIETK